MNAVVEWWTVLLSVAMYLAPTLMALVDSDVPVLSSRNRVVLLVNVLLGWTGIGWLAALIILVRWPE